MNPEGFTHLIINGCSFAYAENVDYVDKWYTKLAKDTGLVPVVLAKPGAGNDRIFRTTAEYAFKKSYMPRYVFNPLFIIAFSQAERREEFNPVENCPEGVYMPDPDNYHKSSDFSKAIFNASSTNEGLIFNLHRKYLHWFNTTNLLKTLNYSYLVSDYFTEKNDYVNSEILVRHPELMHAIQSDPNKLADFDSVTSGYEPLPCGHDGPEAQQYLTEYIHSQYIKRFVK